MRDRTVMTVPEIPKTRSKTRREGPRRDAATGRVFGGNPGNRGGPGRPTSEFKQFLADHVLGSPQMRKNLMDIVEVDLAALSAKDPVLAVRAAGLVVQVASWAADRVEGKATQSLRFDPNETGRVAALRELTNEELIAALKTLDSDEATEQESSPRDVRSMHFLPSLRHDVPESPDVKAD